MESYIIRPRWGYVPGAAFFMTNEFGNQKPGHLEFLKKEQKFMKVKSTCTISFLLLLIFLSPVNAFAQLFGSDEENWEKVFFRLEKIYSRLGTLESRLGTLETTSQLENLLREIEEIKHTVELNKSETMHGLKKTQSKLDDLEYKVKNEVLNKIDQQNKLLEQFGKKQEKLQANLTEGLAQDMEKFNQSSKANFKDFAVANNETLGRVVQQLEAQSATIEKGFGDTIFLFQTEVIPAIAEESLKNQQMVLDHLTHANKETRTNLEAFSAKNQEVNQKLREILEESLKQGLETKFLLDSIKKDQGVAHASLEEANQNIARNHIVTNKNLQVADEKINKLAKSLKTLQAQNTASSETLGTLKADLEHAGEFNKLADEKFNKLIELTSELAIHSAELENSVVGQLKDSAQKEEARNIKVDLANEKLSRLIEILKTIAKEQAKLDPVATTLGAVQKSQADLKKNQEVIKKALADLRRKANVNISRNDDLKKTLRQLQPAKNRAGKK